VAFEKKKLKKKYNEAEEWFKVLKVGSAPYLEEGRAS